MLVQCTEDGQWQALVGMLGDPDWGHLDVFATTAQRSEQYDAVEALVAAAVADFAVEEFLTTAHAVGVPACRVHGAADVLAWEQLRARESFRCLEVAPGVGVEAPAVADPVHGPGARPRPHAAVARRPTTAPSTGHRGHRRRSVARRRRHRSPACG